MSRVGLLAHLPDLEEARGAIEDLENHGIDGVDRSVTDLSPPGCPCQGWADEQIRRGAFSQAVRRKHRGEW